MKGLVVLSLAVVIAVGGIGRRVVAAWVSEESVAAWTGGVVVFAGLVNLLACWASFVPFAVLRAMKATNLLLEAGLLAMGIRLSLVIGVMLVATFEPPWPITILGSWISVFYVTLLAVETGWVVRLSRRGGAQNGSGQEPGNRF